jgi:hypothetical protein
LPPESLSRHSILITKSFTLETTTKSSPFFLDRHLVVGARVGRAVVKGVKEAKVKGAKVGRVIVTAGPAVTVREA